MQGRPSLGVRVAVALLGVLLVMVNVTLMLSDRAPRVLQTVAGPVVDRIVARLDSDGAATAALGARNVGSDSIVHFGLWGVAMLVIGLAIWSWIAILPAAGLLFVASIAVELAQGRYSNRHVEFRDVEFNGLGIAAGTVLAMTCYVLGSAAASLRRTG